MTRRSYPLLLSAAVLAGCATAQKPDPLEPMNRAVFAFNDSLDRNIARPVATGYRNVVPSPVRRSITNFFANLADPWSAVNLLLQGRPEEGATSLGRFATNTTVGVLGLFDVATGWGMPRRPEDFGQTLGVWGAGPGAYLVWPLFGPSTYRDTAGLTVDFMAGPQSYISDAGAGVGLTAVQLLNQRASMLDAGRWLDDSALDRYLFVRDAYLQRRLALIRDREPERPPESDRERLSVPLTLPAGPAEAPARDTTAAP